MSKRSFTLQYNSKKQKIESKCDGICDELAISDWNKHGYT